VIGLRRNQYGEPRTIPPAMHFLQVIVRELEPVGPINFVGGHTSSMW
jgi:hypothetical protein